MRAIDQSPRFLGIVDFLLSSRLICYSYFVSTEERFCHPFAAFTLCSTIIVPPA